MLEIKNISKYFNSSLILNNLSFTVSKGNIFGIIGPNGAGKTTTLRIILGILTPSAGNVSYGNEPVNQNFLNLTGYLPEERGLYPKSSVINSLVYFSQLKGLSFSDANKKANYWLERLNLADFKKYNIEELSKGNQQKVQFISAIIHDPKILILDEPFSGFDPVNQSIFREIIEEMKANRIIILSTHLMDLAESLCDDIFLINKGEKILEGNINEILNSEDQNKYEITFKDKIDDKVLNRIKNYSAVNIDNFNLIIDIKNKVPSELLKELSDEFEILEFKRKSKSLHQLFIDLVN